MSGQFAFQMEQSCIREVREQQMSQLGPLSCQGLLRRLKFDRLQSRNSPTRGALGPKTSLSDFKLLLLFFRTQKNAIESHGHRGYFQAKLEKI